MDYKKRKKKENENVIVN